MSYKRGIIFHIQKETAEKVYLNQRDIVLQCNISITYKTTDFKFKKNNEKKKKLKKKIENKKKLDKTQKDSIYHNYLSICDVCISRE